MRNIRLVYLCAILTGMLLGAYAASTISLAPVLPSPVPANLVPEEGFPASEPVLVAEAPISLIEGQILATALVLEAANQGQDGMEAVLHVLLNRAHRQQRPLMEVVTRPYVLASLLPATRDKQPWDKLVARAQRDSIAWPQAIWLVQAYRRGELGPDFTGGATHFDRRDFPPAWLNTLRVTARIGDHVFLRER